MAFTNVSDPVPGLKAPTLAEFRKGPIVDVYSTRDANNSWTNHWLAYNIFFTKHGQAMTLVNTPTGNERHKGVLASHLDVFIGTVGAEGQGWVVVPRAKEKKGRS